MVDINNDHRLSLDDATLIDKICVEFEKAINDGQQPCIEEYLKSGNLLKQEVKAVDVAKAFVSLALAEKTTGSIVTVDGGNIAAALR